MSFVSNPFSIPFDRVIPGVAGTPAMTVRDATNPLIDFAEYNPTKFFAQDQSANTAFVGGDASIPNIGLTNTGDGSFAGAKYDGAGNVLIGINAGGALGQFDLVNNGGFLDPQMFLQSFLGNVQAICDITTFIGGNGNARLFLQSRAGGTNLNIAVKPDRSATASLGAGVLPATPEGFLSWELDGNVIKIPYYNL